MIPTLSQKTRAKPVSAMTPLKTVFTPDMRR